MCHLLRRKSPSAAGLEAQRGREVSSTLGFREHEAKGAPCLLKEAMEGCTLWKDLRLRKGINQLCQYQQHSDARTPSVDQAWSSPSERLNLNLYGAWLRTQPLSPLPLPLLQPSLLLSKKKNHSFSLPSSSQAGTRPPMLPGAPPLGRGLASAVGTVWSPRFAPD